MPISPQAQAIYDQIGGGAFVMMGARDIVAGETKLHFGIGRNAGKVSKIVVEIDESTDTYTVSFWQGRGLKIRETERTELVYVDQLRKVIEKRTGMYLNL